MTTTSSVCCVNCGHPVDWHDAGECWTDEHGQETHGETSCSCSWLTLPDTRPAIPDYRWLTPHEIAEAQAEQAEDAYRWCQDHDNDEACALCDDGAL